MRNKFILPLATMLTVLVSLLLSGLNTSAQTLKLRFPFDDAGPGTTTASDTSSGGLAVTLNMENQNPGTGVDMHGGAGSGIQGQGGSLNLSTNSIAGNLAGTIAFVTNDANIGSIGTVSNFTVSMWFKLVSNPTNTANQGPRFFVMGTNGVIDSGTVTNSISMQYNSAAAPAAGFPSNSIAGRINTSQFTLPLYYPLATNVWQFIAITYDGGSNAIMYYGTEATPAKLMTVNNIGPQTVNFGPTGTLQVGNRLNGRNRPLPGWIDDFRFYTGTGDANFVENVRQSSCPVVISGLTPDGSTLLEGSNTLSFTASSANTINTSAIKVSLNGTDISSGLVFGGTPSAVTVSYSALPVNPTIVNNSSLNGVTLGIQVTDASGIRATNLYTYDAFSPTNFTFEAEDYNFSTVNPPFSGGGNFIDNPRYAFVSAPDTYWQRFSELLDDYDDNANPAGTLRVYRSSLDAVETEFALGGAPNGGVSIGELMRQKVLDALALDPTVREVNVGFFDGGTGADLPNWMNYTRTYPSGNFNIYTRVAAGAGVSSTLAAVTSGVGTETQTTTNLGTFVTANSGGWDSFAWSPLRDANGNLVRVTLGGVSTLRLTAGPAGGGNNNFLMLTPANTNLPSISGLYPNGTNMFQPTNAIKFTVSSPSGVTINASSIQVQLTATSVTSTTITNLTSGNGLTVTGTASSKNVSGVLASNVSYVAVISATDVNGSPASQTVIFDTYSPVLTWEAEDYDFGGGMTFDPNITTDEYSNTSATLDVDYHYVPNGAGYAYRTLDTPGAGTEVTSDSPQRLAYIGTGFTDYDLGWYDGGFWVNYTRTIPPGVWNVVARSANGTTGSGGVTLSQVTSGQGTTNQVTTNLGTFTVPATGGWETFVWVPMRDAGGNLAKLTGTGAQQTLRGTSQGANNENFYMLIPANTNQPLITGLFPDGTAAFQNTNKLVFTATPGAGATIATSNITLTLDGVLVSGLQFAGSSTSWNVTYPNLAQNTNHTATINVLDSNGNSASTTVSFDTFKSSYYQWEAEDYDYTSNGVAGLFIDNPQVDAYAGLDASNGVDFVSANAGGVYTYRPSGVATGTAGDFFRAQFTGTNVDYVIGFWSAGAWQNYTRHYTNGNYNVWGRFAAGGGDSAARLSIVTSGWGTANQTSNLLGTFTVPNTGWGSYIWSPLRDAGGNLVSVPLTGPTNTLKLQRTDPSEAIPDVNVNFMMLVPLASPVVLSAAHVGANINISFQTTSGFSYQVQFKNNLTDASWTSLGGAITGDGTIKSVSDPTGTSRFYRVSVQ